MCQLQSFMRMAPADGVCVCVQVGKSSEAWPQQMMFVCVCASRQTLGGVAPADEVCEFVLVGKSVHGGEGCWMLF